MKQVIILCVLISSGIALESEEAQIIFEKIKLLVVSVDAHNNSLSETATKLGFHVDENN